MSKRCMTMCSFSLSPSLPLPPPTLSLTHTHTHTHTQKHTHSFGYRRICAGVIYILFNRKVLMIAVHILYTMYTQYQLYIERKQVTVTHCLNSTPKNKTPSIIQSLQIHKNLIFKPQEQDLIKRGESVF